MLKIAIFSAQMLRFLDEIIEQFPDQPDFVLVKLIMKDKEYFIEKFFNEDKHVLLIQIIKFGNFTCLPRTTVEKMINDKATWSSFSGALAMLEKERSAVPSIRGTRYFGPSKMSFKNLILHSLSIISVFKINVLIRSILFLLVYMFLIHQKISIIMIVPVILVLILLVSVFTVSKRENLEELNNSLKNILNINNF